MCTSRPLLHPMQYLSALPNAMEELCALAQRGNMRLGPLLVLLARSLAQSLCGGDAKAAGRCEADLLALAHAGVLEGEPAGVLATALLEGGCAAAAGTPGRASCQKLLRWGVRLGWWLGAACRRSWCC